MENNVLKRCADMIIYINRLTLAAWHMWNQCWAAAWQTTPQHAVSVSLEHYWKSQADNKLNFDLGEPVEAGW